MSSPRPRKYTFTTGSPETFSFPASGMPRKSVCEPATLLRPPQSCVYPLNVISTKNLILISLAHSCRGVNGIQFLQSKVCVVQCHHRQVPPQQITFSITKRMFSPDILKAAQYHIFPKKETEIMFHPLSLPT